MPTTPISPEVFDELLADIAAGLNVKTAGAPVRIRPIASKSHGRKAVSLFALGLVVWRKLFAAWPPVQIFAALRQAISPKIRLNP